MDVKSLFKSGKKTIKAFKIATGPTTDSKDEAGHVDGHLEAFDAPSVSKVESQTAPKVEDYKADQDQSLKPSVSWSAEPVEEPVVEVRQSNSSYIPPSQRRLEATRAMPTVAEANKLAASAPARTTSASGSAVSGAPTRLKLVTSASKKAAEEEEKRKEEEKLQRELEKKARRAELERQMSAPAASEATSNADQVDSAPVTSNAIKAAPLEQVYAKYIGRAKTGRKFATAA